MNAAPIRSQNRQRRIHVTELALKGYHAVRQAADRWFGAWALILLTLLSVALLDAGNLPRVSRFALGAFGSTLPYIFVAVLLIAYLKATGAEHLVARAFEGREARMIVFAALIGGLAPFCSCEVIPFIAGLLSVGAPLSAVMAFWLSSPLIDPPTVLITAGALGWHFAIGKAVAAVALGLIGGFGVMLLGRYGVFSAPLRARNGCSRCGCDATPFTGSPQWRFWTDARRRATFHGEARSNLVFLAKWLMLAYLLEAVLVTYVPAETIGGLVGGEGAFPIVLGALVGAPAYLNSYAAPALVAGLVEQGMSSGAAMAFLIAGAVISMPAMAAVWSLVRRPVFFAYLGFGLIGAILIGAAFSAIA
jgi:uncharacterized membrane protein YraQ (UPF0718 family)